MRAPAAGWSRNSQATDLAYLDAWARNNVQADVATVKADMERIRLDELDSKILQELQEDARISNVELADRVGLSPAPCLRRVRALEEAGVIRKYVTLLDPQAVNLAVTVFVQVTLNLQVEGRLDTFEDAIRIRPEVLDCYMMAGEADYLLRVVVPDVAAYERFLKESLTHIENVASLKSTFALKQAKYSTVLPIGAKPKPADTPASEPSSRRKSRIGRR